MPNRSNIPTIILGVLAIMMVALIGWVGFDLAHQRVAATPPPAAVVALPDCSTRTDVVSVWRDDPTPCDVNPPQRMDVFGYTRAECDDHGGQWIGDGIDVCQGVDY
jgi:hypothetical protein